MDSIPEGGTGENDRTLESDLESVEAALLGIQKELRLQESNSDKLARAQAELKAAQADIRKTQDDQAYSISLRKTLLKVAIGAAVLAVIAALAAGYGSWQVYKQQNQAEKDRMARTVASCRQYNEQVKRTVDGDVAQAVGLINVADAINKAQGKPLTDPVTKALFINHEKQVSQQVNPYRDCTPEGIRAYLAKTSLTVVCDSDGDGFCKQPAPTTTIPAK